jgi:hypothetical protein
MDVAPDGGAVFEEVLRLSLVERVGGLKCHIKVLGACVVPARLRSGDTVSHGHHLLPVALLVLVPLVAASLG